jgi:tol-pal system protein YbgF
MLPFRSLRCFPARPRLPLVALALLLAGPLGCATGKGASADANAVNTALVERLRTENAAQLRRVEELENQVFVLTSELDARRGGEPPPAAPPALPEVKLSRADQNQRGAERASDRADKATEASTPQSLVDETEVEYAGAAAERSTSKRPVLKLWGVPGETGETAETESQVVAERAEADQGSEPRARDRRRLALTRRPPRHPELPPPPPRVAPRPAKPEEIRADQELYQAALVHLRAGRHEEAVSALRAFVAAHPQHDLADNAQYWLGECFYDRKDYSTALREFRRVADDFPSGNKVPDALLKLGLSYLALGSARPGHEALADLVRRFPRHPATALAEAKLAELGPAATLTTARKGP